MHFHLPKPLHGWREFVGEVGIIVIGVMIALGAEQLIERWHDREKVDRAIEALRVEVGKHEFASAEIEMTTHCIFAQIEAISTRISGGDGAPLPKFTDEFQSGFVIRIPNRVYSDATWQSVNSSDTLRRLDPKRADDLAIYYAQLTQQRNSNRAALDLVSSLNALSRMMPRGEEGRLHFLERAEQLRSTIREMDLVAGQLRDELAHAGLLGPREEVDKLLADSGTLKFCRAHGLPIAALRPADPRVV